MSQSKNSEKFFWRKSAHGDIAILEDSEDTTGEDIRFSKITVQPRAKLSAQLFLESKLVIGIPTHNSERSIAKTVVSLRPLDADILVCDDFSTDSTEQIARSLNCKILKHPRELGASDSITSIYLAARRLHATTLLTVDPHVNFVLRDALNLLEKVQRGECDIAIGSDGSYQTEPATSESSVHDINSLFRAYGKRALALITPARTTSVVPESDVIEFARSNGLKVKEYRISSASELRPRASDSWKVRMMSIPNTVERTLSRIADTAALRHPLLFFGLPAVAMFAATLIQTLETLRSWGAAGPSADYGFYFAGYDLVIALIMGLGALILESQKKDSRLKVQKQQEQLV